MESQTSKTLLQQAGKLLARRAYSRGELRQRLSRHADETQLEGVLNHLEELRLLNDSDYAYNFALCRMKHNGWGRIKVYFALLRHQVAPHLAESAIDRVRREADEGFLLKQYLEKHYHKIGIPQDGKGIRRLISHLRRRGFCDDTILGTLRYTIPSSAWERFEIGD